MAIPPSDPTPAGCRGGDQDQGTVEVRLVAQGAVLGVPPAVEQVVAEGGFEAFVDLRRDKAPGGVGQAGAGVEEAFGSAVVRLAEAVDALQRDRQWRRGTATEAGQDRVDRRVPAGFGVDRLGRVVVQPELAQRGRIAGQDTTGPRVTRRTSPSPRPRSDH